MHCGTFKLSGYEHMWMCTQALAPTEAIIRAADKSALIAGAPKGDAAAAAALEMKLVSTLDQEKN